MKSWGILLIGTIFLPFTIFSQHSQISSSTLTLSLIPSHSTVQEADQLKVNSTDSLHFITSPPLFRVQGNNSTGGIQRLNILPEYARENPTGYTFLCRLELDIEKRSPLPVWVQVGNMFSNTSGGSAYLQLKMFRF